MTALLDIEGLTRVVPGFALRDVSLRVSAGSVMGFLGMNGAGKSTTLGAVMGLVKPDRGTVRVFGEDVAGATAYKQRVGFVSEESWFFADRTVGWMGRFASGIYEAWDTVRYAQLCTDFGLPEDRPASKLSRGMKVKLGLAVALSHGARLLVLDEPTSGLDPVARRQILGLLRAFMAEAEDRAVLFSSHLTQDVEAFADQVTVLHRGQVLVSESTQAFLARGSTVEAVYLDLVDTHDARLG